MISPDRPWRHMSPEKRAEVARWIREATGSMSVNRMAARVELSFLRVKNILSVLNACAGEAGVASVVAMLPRYTPSPLPRADALPGSVAFLKRAGIVSALRDAASPFRAKEWAAMSDRDRRDFARGVADAFAHWPLLAKSFLIESIRRT